MSPFISARDRLLLVFADLSSYGICARPAVDGSVAQARDRVIAEAAQQSPFAPNDYVFWRLDDEPLAFAESGALIGPLPLHFGNPSLAPAIAQALSNAGFPDLHPANSDEREPRKHAFCEG